MHLVEKAVSVYFTEEGPQPLGRSWSEVDRIGLEQDLAEGKATISYPLEDNPSYTHMVRSREGAAVWVQLKEGDRLLPNLRSGALEQFIDMADSMKGCLKALARYVYVEERPYLPLPLSYYGIPVHLDKGRGALVTLHPDTGAPITIKEDRFDALRYEE